MSVPFIDTNIFVYALEASAKGKQALLVLAAPYQTGVQAMNEVARVMLQKLNYPIEAVSDVSQQFRQAADSVQAVLEVDHELALLLTAKYRFGWWDSILLATALRSGAETFLSEDLMHGQMIEGTMRVINPFRA